MTYRILPAEEWYRLDPIMARQGKAVPDQRLAAAAVAEKDGEIKGVLFLQMVIHMEPLVIEDPYVNFLSLQETLETPMLLDKQGLSVYCYTQDEKMNRIVQLAGFERLGEFWGKEV